MYGTVDRLKEIAQLGPGDLYLYPASGQTADERLDEVLAEFLAVAKEIIDADRNRDYEKEVVDGARSSVPLGIVHIAYRIAGNMIIRAREMQHQGQVSRDDFDVSRVSSGVLDESIARDLTLYPAKPNFGMRRLRNAAELAEIAEGGAA